MFLPIYPRLGRRVLARGVPAHLVPDRADAAWRKSPRRHENPTLVRAFRHTVPRMITLTYASVSASPRSPACCRRDHQVRPLMGADLIIVVVRGGGDRGMGSIMDRSSPAFALGVIEGLTKYFYPEASNTVVFVLIGAGVAVKPSGLTGRAADMTAMTDDTLR